MKTADRTAPLMPAKTRTGLRVGAVLLVTIAAAANITHTHDHAARHGQTGAMPLVIAVLPDIMLILSILRLRYDRRSVWAWSGVLAASGFVAWASISTSRQYPSAWVISLYAVATAVISTGLLHGGSGETLEEYRTRTDAVLEDAEETARRAVADASAARTEASGLGVRVEELDAALASAQGALDAALRDAQDARAEASAMTVRVAELDAALASAAAVQDTIRTPSMMPVRTRPRGARKASGQGASGPDDVQKRRIVRDEFKASVRAGDAWPNARLACALTQCTDACQDGEHRPPKDALTNARKRASEWRAEVAKERPDAEDDAEPDSVHEGAR